VDSIARKAGYDRRVQPLVGIPLCLDDRGRWREGRTYHYVHAAYARAIERAGGLAVYLPLQSDVRALIERVDALLVPGGDDLLPPRAYPPDVRFDPVPDGQLAFDRALLGSALARDLPVLGICYGMQLLALAHGGTLHYDIATDLPAAGAHRLPERDGRHALAIAPNTRLAAIAGASRARVGSRHHQAVSETGRELCVAARAEDGVIEAIERPAGAFCVGVQWHPETDADALSEALFQAFVAAAKR
jgi:putative glutamine amidotransferase